MIHVPSTTSGTAEDGGRQHHGQRVAGPPERCPRRLGEPHPQHRRRRGSRRRSSAIVSPTRWRSAPSAATNTNSTAPGHERLATGPGVEGERVGGEHGEGGADGGQQRPAADVLDGCDGVRGTGRARGRGRPTRCPTSRASGRWRRTSRGRRPSHGPDERGAVSGIDSSAWTWSRRSSSDVPWPTSTITMTSVTNCQSVNTRANPRAATNEYGARAMVARMSRPSRLASSATRPGAPIVDRSLVDARRGSPLTAPPPTGSGPVPAGLGVRRRRAWCRRARPTSARTRPRSARPRRAAGCGGGGRW